MGLFRWTKQRLAGPAAGWINQRIDLYFVANGALRREIGMRAPRCGGVLLDIGCGGQPYRGLFTEIKRYIAMDRRPERGVDFCGDAQCLPFSNMSFDTVLCSQVLEHVPEPAAVMKEIARVLRPGGALLLTTPQTWGLHLEPNDFYRYTKYGLAHLSRQAGLDVVEVAPTTGLVATMAQRFADVISVAHIEPARLVYRVLGKMLVWPFLWLGDVIDRIFKRRGDTLDNILLARKPNRD